MARRNQALPVIDAPLQLGGGAVAPAPSVGAATAPARSLQQTAGNVTQIMGDALQRIRTREDAVERARAFNEFQLASSEEYRRLLTEDDISRPESLRSYTGFLDKLAQETLAQHRGSPESKAALAERIGSLRANSVDTAAAASVTAQRKLVADTVQKQINTIAGQAGGSPDMWPDLIAQGDAAIDDMAPAMTPDEEREARDALRANVLLSGVTTLVDRGAYGEAERVMAISPEFSQLDADVQRRVRSRITQARYAEEKEETALLRRVQQVEAIAGPLSREQKLQLAGISVPQGRETLSSKIREYETVLGRPANEQEIAKMAGTFVASESDGGFGNSLNGIILDKFSELAPAFGAGLTDAAQDRQFMNAVTQYLQPRNMPNPDTGVMELIRPELPPYVAEALEARGMGSPGTGVPGPGIAGAGAPPDVKAGTLTASTGAAQPATPSQEPILPGGKTIFQLNEEGLVTGPAPAAAEALGKSPLLGGVMPVDEFTKARNFIPLMQRDLVRVLQNNPRYAEGERKAIEDEISVSPQVWDNAKAYRDRLIAIDDALARREQTAFKTAQSPNVTREERQQAMNVLNGIQSFRETMGVPPRVKTPEEAKKLPAGSLFIDPQGNIRQVPGAAFTPSPGMGAPSNTTGGASR